ncbi:MAG: hypothetical protein U0230_25050 [Polyangiales bacterium]
MAGQTVRLDDRANWTVLVPADFDTPFGQALQDDGATFDAHPECDLCIAALFVAGQLPTTDQYRRHGRPLPYRAVYGVVATPYSDGLATRVQVITLEYRIRTRGAMSVHGLGSTDHWRTVDAGSRDQAALLDLLEACPTGESTEQLRDDPPRNPVD